MGYYGMPGMSYLPPPMPGQNLAPMQIPKDVIRIGEQAIWSTQRYADATALANTIARVFSVALGSQGQGFGAGLTTAETSLREAGRIPGAYACDVYGIALHVYTLVGDTPGTSFPVIGADLRNVHANCSLRWDFISSFIDVAPAYLIGAGGGIYGMTADTGAADGVGGSRTVLNNGNGQLWIYREHAVALPSNSTFAMNYVWGGNAIAVDGGANNYALCLRTSLLAQFRVAIEIA